MNYKCCILASYCVKDNAFIYLCTLPSTQFVLVQVYHVYFPYDMFQVRFGCCTITFSLLFSPTLASVQFTHWECVVYVLFVCPFFCQVYCFWDVYIVKSLNFRITPRVKLVKIYCDVHAVE
jgi:hypothetical protein